MRGQTEQSIRWSESYVILELQRADGVYLTLRRQVVGSVSTYLVTVWDGPALSQPDSEYERRDYYVRRPGAAQQDRGFHRFFTDWCGWALPEVTRFDGSTVPLYIEAIAPLWIVEQKRGWAGLQALTPTYLGISDVKKRALEHMLGLDALRRRARIQELEQQLNEIRGTWRERTAAFNAEAKYAGGAVRGMPQQPTGDWPPAPEPSVLIFRDNKWTAIREAARSTTEEIDELNTKSRSREAANSAISEELGSTEDELELAMAASAQLRRSVARDRESVEHAERRLATIEQDRRRHKDLLVLRDLGSGDESLLRTDQCPVCNRELGDVLLDETGRDRVMGVDETINYLDAQADLTKTIIASVTASLEAREMQINAVALRSSELRSRIFALRTSLTGGGAAIADAEALLTARRRLELYQNTEQAFGGLSNDLAELSQDWRTTQSELQDLRSAELSNSDVHKLDRLQSDFLVQLSDYGFKSLQPASMSISRDTYLPVHEGYDPAFESSASDVIRIIWAYLLSLLRVSGNLELNHPGLVIFDEPRQQMTHELSFRELLRRAALSTDNQVVFATSEGSQELANMLDGLNHNTIDFDGKVLKPRVD